MACLTIHGIPILSTMSSVMTAAKTAEINGREMHFNLEEARAPRPEPARMPANTTARGEGHRRGGEGRDRLHMHKEPGDGLRRQRRQRRSPL